MAARMRGVDEEDTIERLYFCLFWGLVRKVRRVWMLGEGMGLV